MRLLIDLDSAIYKAGFSNEERSYLIFTEEDGVVAGEKYKKDALAWIEAQEDSDKFDCMLHSEAGPVK